jgi:O-antigen/teichoic acid export membrane protein
MPVYVSLILTGLLPLYQQVILAFFAPDMKIGNYKAAYNFITLLSILTVAVTTTLLPAFSKLESSQKQLCVPTRK